MSGASRVGGVTCRGLQVRPTDVDGLFAALGGALVGGAADTRRGSGASGGPGGGSAASADHARVSIESVFDAVCGPLNPTRAALVRTAFEKVDVGGEGAVRVAALKAAYNAGRHPAVAAGRMSIEAAQAELTAALAEVCGADPFMNLDRFERYHALVGATIDEDDYFRLLLWNVWTLGGKRAGARSAEVGAHEGMLDAMSRMTVIAAGAPMSGAQMSGSLPGREERSSHRAHVARAATGGGLSLFVGGTPAADTARGKRVAIESRPPDTVRRIEDASGHFGGDEVAALRQSFMRAAVSTAAPAPPTATSVSAAVGRDTGGGQKEPFTAARDKLRAALTKRGLKGVVGLARTFAAIDTDGARAAVGV